MSRLSTSKYVCERCGLPLQVQGGGYRHAVNAQTKHLSCGRKPEPVERGRISLTPGTPLAVWRPAGSVTINHRPYGQRFRPGSFDYLVGTTTRVRLNGREAAWAVITGTEVAKDGAGVLLSLEVLDAIGEAA